MNPETSIANNMETESYHNNADSNNHRYRHRGILNWLYNEITVNHVYDSANIDEFTNKINFNALYGGCLINEYDPIV